MAGYRGPIFDMDVHHYPLSDRELLPYFSKEWLPYAEEVLAAPPKSGREILPLWNPPFHFQNPLIAYEGIDRLKFADPEPKHGKPYDQYIADTLDVHGDQGFGIALSYNVGQFGTFMNPSYAAEVARATNDWNIDTWLSLGDDRLWGEVATADNVPEAAAAEIRRVGAHDRIRGVCLGANGLGRPTGDPVRDPIFAAANEMDLAVSWHPFPSDRPNRQITHTGGLAGSIEYMALMGQALPNYISSLIVNGTFEKFPDLRFVFRETGVLWLPAVIWKLDSMYEQLKAESPWVKRWPSEYIHDHMTFCTQPLEEAPDGASRSGDVLGKVDWIEDVLCFSTDYPHAIAYDEVQWVAKHLPESWHRKVFCDNACAAYRIPTPAADDRVAA